MGLDKEFSNFFELVPKFNQGKPKALVTGQIAKVPATFISKIPQVLDFERASGASLSDIKYKVRNMNSDDFTRRSSKLPVPSLPLNDTEEFIISKAKRRPCIFISMAEDLSLDSEYLKFCGTKGHLTGCNGVFIPMFSAKSEDKRSGVPEDIVLRSKVLMYDNYFYIKGEKTKSILLPEVNEGIARLDFMFSASLTVPGVTATDLKLADPLINILLTFLGRYLKLNLHEKNDQLLDEVLGYLDLHWEEYIKANQPHVE